MFDKHFKVQYMLKGSNDTLAKDMSHMSKR